MPWVGEKKHLSSYYLAIAGVLVIVIGGWLLSLRIQLLALRGSVQNQFESTGGSARDSFNASLQDSQSLIRRIHAAPTQESAVVRDASPTQTQDSEESREEEVLQATIDAFKNALSATQSSE